ncbi:hypothetical protein [Streptomyces sp. NPDC006610]|jgi:glucose-6-phosphate isomerase
MAGTPLLTRRPQSTALEDHRAHRRARLRDLFAADPLGAAYRELKEGH